MASNLHHHHHCICHSSAASAAPTACYCCSIPVPHHPPPPDLHSLPPCFNNPQQQPHLFDPCPNSPYNTQCRHPNPLHQTGKVYVQELHHQPVFSSLLRRIASLESSLRRRRSISSHSLRDTAARTIQTHFRAFLVRRSRTLRHLKELASIKSALNTLKSSASNIDPLALSHKAKNLLLQLGAIQDSDPMIRDGKNSITRELVKLIELIDVESYSLSSRIVKNVKHGCAKNKSRVHVLQEMEKMESIINKYLELRKSVEEEEEEEDDDDEEEEFESPRVSVVKKSGVLRKGGLGKRNGGVNSKVNKGVSFAEDSNIFRYPQVNLKPVSDREGDSVDGNEELIENLCRRVEDLGVSLKDVEVDEEAQLEDGGGSRGSSDAETEPNYSSRKEGKFGIRLDQGDDNGTFVFSAPLPVKMEGRAGFSNRHKTVRFAD
ncbi:PREDICTED: BAG family molecular chaperone regulator 8, chloroplastic [Ipomoea nil]|uniref:BAG family molecular chaperone regulator 8, chloroplastic n=1 Tax=Ipomoea nil TaxID=35883 RepID=UPI000900AAB9|nr:PREDICTED: BAG family molecular chaperone regulator 8, chloroplastic [Ipomoea nil]